MPKNDSLNGTTLPLRKIRQRESAVPKHRYGRYQIADIITKFFDTINSLKKTSEIHPSINVRAKIIFYLNEQILNTYYLGMFYIYCQNGIYEVNEEFRNMINAIIKKSGKLPMY